MFVPFIVESYKTIMRGLGVSSAFGIARLLMFGFPYLLISLFSVSQYLPMTIIAGMIFVGFSAVLFSFVCLNLEIIYS